MPLEIVILAAGQGTRMRSSLPKILHKIADRTLLEHVHALASRLRPDKVTVIYGHGGERVLQTLEHLNVIWVEQREQLGTGHAVMQVADDIDEERTVLILYGDVPLLGDETVEKLIPLAQADQMGLLTVNLADPYGYGRIIRDSTGRVVRIVEEKDASPEERHISEVNTGILAIKGNHLKTWLSRLENNNAQREYYLTDVIAMAVADGVRVETVQPRDSDEVLGVNNREQLAHLERVFQKKLAETLMRNGVTLRDPSRFDVRGQIESIGRDVEIDVNVILEGRIRLGDNVRIGANCLIKDSEIGNDVEVLANCVIEDASVGQGCRIGPFARIRPETRIEDQVHIGNFVEIKKSAIASCSKVNHLSYIGDTIIGRDVNVGAGTITCNYDGANKHQTVIEDGAFIGSDTQLVAPVRVGKNATIGAGATVTKDAPENALTLSRAKQVTIEGWQRPTKKRS
ncbi:bifunctional UDP-N-acetylglucosamine diphosphorylase/glucosamine-1-phosphate N-acetyltransferase GlmU [Methylocaldum sp.]|uniref:bifunctional UDP-N-acetylglucosamine diphosphorylase/glucosamine-1-phosphate N-acetyltransferase GlmU n=1 Tax=Methylocaldum sp. TaxID=1969727 RepID=UPI002D2BED7E|nr:bifunctional UDP-N-acetylglucosamine diphosphorylase/glucosamine-1-phosphate N-acetyltransferase GlmU [Methylocaldum sp.]HYE37748.1 bifunctional UDP-N-acetylglucosamine diphosphorylase/glucosamine-1-phosphate N-acetyltransferase GlmU [Methylocaldum sp.]